MNNDHSSEHANRFDRFLLSSVVFLLGACGLAYEYTLSKIAADLLGNSVQQWTTMIATMLFAMGLGAEWQSKIPTNKITDKLISSQVYLALLGGFAPMLMLYGFSLMGDYFVLIQYGLALAVGTMIGFEIPLLMRINEKRDSQMKLNLARILKMDYIGALVGALLWTFIFMRYLSLSHVSFILGFFSLFSALLILFLYRTRIQAPRWRLLEISTCTVFLTLGIFVSKPLMLHAEQFLYQDKIVFTATTPYQHIILTQHQENGINCYINGHLQFKEEDEFIYHENLVHPAMMLIPNAERVLILGGGDGLAVREVLKYPLVKQVTLVDIDPQMTELAKNQPDFVRLNQNALNNERIQKVPADKVSEGDSFTLKISNQRQRAFRKDQYEVTQLKVVNIDASSFLKNTSGLFDVVILDFPDPSSPDLAKLYSKPFYMSLRKHLKPSSIIVQQSGSSFHAKEAFLCIGRTLQASGFDAAPYHDNVPSFGEWGWWIATLNSKTTNPSDTSISLKTRILQLDHSDLKVNTRYLTTTLVKASLFFGKDQLHSPYSDYTTLTESRVYHYYLQGWN
ncbi:MAG: polyamine aminopropyltransferase [Verrucomicrobiales bacterium]|nr:polyamine aminopropyltransferase [Verrucomicrobiales bacterium]